MEHIFWLPLYIFPINFDMSIWVKKKNKSWLRSQYQYKNYVDFPGSPVDKNSACNAEDRGSIPVQGTKIPRATDN